MEVAVIYNQFHQSLLAFIRSRIRCREDAEDILQNVFIRITSNLGKLSNQERLQSWIFAITRNAITDYYRVNGSRKSIALDSSIEENVSEEIDTDTARGLEQCMNSMIGLLPEIYREIIIDSELKGARQKDLAEKYGMAYPSVRSRVQRGREKLKQLFYDCCHIETDHLGNVMEARGRAGCDSPCDPGACK